MCTYRQFLKKRTKRTGLGVYLFTCGNQAELFSEHLMLRIFSVARLASVWLYFLSNFSPTLWLTTGWENRPILVNIKMLNTSTQIILENFIKGEKKCMEEVNSFWHWLTLLELRPDVCQKELSSLDISRFCCLVPLHYYYSPPPPSSGQEINRL